MKRIKTGQKGPAGEAKVRIGGDKVLITFKDNQANPIEFLKSDLPETVKKGTFYVSLSGEGEFLSMRPMDAIVTAHFVHFVADEGEVPQPQEYPGGTAKRKDGTTFQYEPYRAMIAILEIADAEYKGMTIPVFFRYLFVDDGEGNIAIRGSGKNADLLESFLEVAGVYDEDIPFSENVLPKLQKALLKAHQKFRVMLRGGNVAENGFMELPEQDDDSNWDDDDDDKDDDVPWDDDDDE